MAGLEFVTVLALIEYLIFALMAGSAGGRFGIAVSATNGEPTFERYLRVQQNTLEALIVFLPSLWIFAHRVSNGLAIVLALIFIAARAEYFRGYSSSPEGRSIGARVTLGVNVVLLVGAFLGLIGHAL
jgi:uncharacterized MAPEG superfamily protein